MPERRIDMGALDADVADGVTLDDFRDLRPEATLAYVHVDNNSKANLDIQSMPGVPVVTEGEIGAQFVRCGRVFVLVPDADTLAGQVILTLGITWPGLKED